MTGEAAPHKVPITTADYERCTPFADNPLEKLAMASAAIDFDALAGGTVLDIGCNAGHNAIHLASEYRMRPVGIDVVPRHVEVARNLAALAGVEAESPEGSA